MRDSCFDCLVTYERCLNTWNKNYARNFLSQNMHIWKLKCSVHCKDIATHYLASWGSCSLERNLFHIGPMMTLMSFSNLIRIGLLMALKIFVFPKILKMAKCLLLFSFIRRTLLAEDHHNVLIEWYLFSIPRETVAHAKLLLTGWQPIGPLPSSGSSRISHCWDFSLG